MKRTNLIFLFMMFFSSSILFVNAQTDNCMPTLENISTMDDTNICIGSGQEVTVTQDTNNSDGANWGYLITDGTGATILSPGIVPGPTFNFDGAPPGNCLIWGVAYCDDADTPTNMVADITGTYVLSNSIEVVRNQPMMETISTMDDTNICIGSGQEVTVTQDTNNSGDANWGYIVTDGSGTTILSPGIVPGPTFNFDGAPPGNCLIWGVAYCDDADTPTNMVADITGTYVLSNSIEVVRNQPAPEIIMTEDETNVCIGSGQTVNVSLVTDISGTNFGYIVTDGTGTMILSPGIVPGPSFNFDGAPPGTCQIWGIAYCDDVDTPSNMVADITGTYAFSNPIDIVRSEPMMETISTMDDTNICIGAGQTITVNLDTNNSGNSNFGYIITDGTGTTILSPGIVPGPTFNVDGAPPGTCQIWGVAYCDDVDAPSNMVADITGTYVLSNPIDVVRSMACTDPTPTVTIDSTPLTACGLNDGTATANVTGGTALTYLWSNGDTGATATNLPSGPVSVTITYGAGICCVLEVEGEVDSPSEISCEDIFASPVSCNGDTDGTATILPSGGTAPYTFLWSDGQTTQTAIDLAPGDYSVVVTDANGCTCFSTDTTVEEPALLELDPNYLAANTFEGSFGNFTPFWYNTHNFTILGGTQPYNFDFDHQGFATFSVENFNGGANVTVLYADNADWSFTITDSNGCEINSGTITNNDGASSDIGTTGNILDIDEADISFESGVNMENGSIDITTAGCNDAGSVLAYQWTGPNGFSAITEDVYGLEAGLYTVTVICSDGQSTQASYWVPLDRSNGRLKTAIVSSVDVYPNPFENILNIAVNTQQYSQLILSSIDGKMNRILLEGQLSGQYQIDADELSLSNGIYIIALVNKDEKIIQRILLSR